MRSLQTKSGCELRAQRKKTIKRNCFVNQADAGKAKKGDTRKNSRREAVCSSKRAGRRTKRASRRGKGDHTPKAIVRIRRTFVGDRTGTSGGTQNKRFSRKGLPGGRRRRAEGYCRRDKPVPTRSKRQDANGVPIEKRSKDANEKEKALHGIARPRVEGKENKNFSYHFLREALNI